MKSIAVIAALIAISAAPALAQEAEPAPPKPQAPPPCDKGVYTQFDFWAGEWSVFTKDGKKAGENSIKKEEYGCLMVERWTDASGATGQSYNFYDHIAKKWRQVWVSAGATIDYTGGLNEDGAMILVGEIGYRKDGRTAPFRGAWTPNEDGSVTQFFEEYNKETDSWDEWFTGIYKPKNP